jgi:hypothetical protein
VIVNQIEGNVGLPLIMGRSVSLHPAVIAVGVLIVGTLFGIVGLLISVPLISLTLILVDGIWVRPPRRRHAAARPRALRPRPLSAPGPDYDHRSQRGQRHPAGRVGPDALPRPCRGDAWPDEESVESVYAEADSEHHSD